MSNLAIIRNEIQPLKCFEFHLATDNDILLIIPENPEENTKVRDAFEYCSKVILDHN